MPAFVYSLINMGTLRRVNWMLDRKVNWVTDIRSWILDRRVSGGLDTGCLMLDVRLPAIREIERRVGGTFGWIFDAGCWIGRYRNPGSSWIDE